MTGQELFDRAVEVVLSHEGEIFTNHPLDKGGPTKFGIAQRWHPNVNVRDLTREQAIEIYWNRYWLGRGYDQLPEAIAIKVFDLAVNLGEQTVIVCLQRALRACGIKVKIDGFVGPETAAAAHRADPAALMAALRSEAAGEYRLRAAREASQETFQSGWTNRAYA